MENLTLDKLKDRYLLEPIVEYHNFVIDECQDPMVSVLIITYQHFRFLRKCLDSVVNQQTPFKVEVILCDDGSIDGTREICMEYADRHPSSIRLFLNSRKNNRQILDKPCGIVQFVHGLLNTRGKYVSVCSGDDYWPDETKLQQQVEYLEANGNCSLVYQNWIERTVSENGQSESFSNPLSGLPKASTTTYRNFRSELPEQILNVMQEDLFTWFILSNKGDFVCQETIEPVIVNTPVNSISRSIDSTTHCKHVLNAHSQIIAAFRNSPFERKAQLRLVSYVRAISLGLKPKFFTPKIILEAWREIIKQRLLLLFFKDSTSKLARRFRTKE